MNKQERKQALKKLIASIESNEEQKRMKQKFFEEYNIKEEDLMKFQTSNTESLKEEMDEVFILAGEYIKENPDRFKTGTDIEKIRSLYDALAEILDRENESFVPILMDYVNNQTNKVYEVLESIDI